jgi:hypothetical protein
LVKIFSNTLSLCSSLNVRDQASHPYRTTGKIIVLYILIFSSGAKVKNFGVHRHVLEAVATIVFMLKIVIGLFMERYAHLLAQARAIKM